MSAVEFIPGRYSRAIRSMTNFSVLIWTIVLGVSLLWNFYQHRQTMEDTARVTARTAFEKDVVYRTWNAGHGGVFVPITDKTPPNPDLPAEIDSEIQADDGKAYTLVNPAYMSRQVFELQQTATGIQGHITSLNPIRQANAADPWETIALQAFENGSTEVSSVETMNDQPYLRLMRPLMVEEECLTCHASQGYKVGEVRGGISESIPLNPIYAAGAALQNSLLLGHLLIWGAGLAGIGIASKALQKSTNLQQQAEHKLVEMSIHDRLTGLYNRSYFEDTIQRIEEIKLKPVTMFTADLDNLKKVNDTLGHAAGDELIKGAASVLKSSFRSNDVVTRTGGDEFVVILVGSDSEHADRAIERVRTNEEEWNRQHPGLKLSLSIGVAITTQEMTLTEALKLADERMYEEKIRRKNQSNSKNALCHTRPRFL